MHPIWLVKLWILVLMNQIKFIKSSSIKDLLIRDDYDSDIAPKLDRNRPLVVNATLQIVNFRSLQEQDLTFTIDCFVYLSWEENRIPFRFDKQDAITLPAKWLNTFWLPSIYFKNGISGNLHTGQFTTSYFIVTPSKNRGVNIFMASRVSVVLLCDFDFANFPHDSNRCNIDLMSLSERNDTMKLNWDIFKISKRVYNPDFAISDSIASDCSVNYSLGTYSCLRGTVKITRFVKRYYLRKYFPTFLIVCTSFLGFWVPTTSYPARACILTISLLSLITQQVQGQPVRSMYTISYNVWSNACIGIVTLALIEFGWAIVWEEKEKAKKEELVNKIQEICEDNLKQKKERFCYKYSLNCNQIDSYSRIVFPLIFGLFIIFYICFVSFRGN